MALKYDRKVFFDHVRREPFKGLSQGQVDGLNYKLDVWEKHYSQHPLKHLAYCLATSFWETGRKMLPVREIGKGRGRKYGRRAGPYGHVYYGRGDVQLTWHRNYVFAGKKIGVDLEKNPEKALDPAVSARVLFQGCLEGWFTGKKLSDYKSYRNMRRVVNGTDKASTIAALAMHFEGALKAAQTQAVVNTDETSEAIEKMGFAIKSLLKVLAGDSAKKIFSTLITGVLGVKVGGDASSFSDVLSNLAGLNWAEIIAGVFATLEGSRQVQKAVAPDEEDLKEIEPVSMPMGGSLRPDNDGGRLTKAIEKIAAGEAVTDSPGAVVTLLTHDPQDPNELAEIYMNIGAHYAKKAS